MEDEKVEKDERLASGFPNDPFRIPRDFWYALFYQLMPEGRKRLYRLLSHVDSGGDLLLAHDLFLARRILTEMVELDSQKVKIPPLGKATKKPSLFETRLSNVLFVLTGFISADLSPENVEHLYNMAAHLDGERLPPMNRKTYHKYWHTFDRGFPAAFKRQAPKTMDEWRAFAEMLVSDR